MDSFTDTQDAFQKQVRSSCHACATSALPFRVAAYFTSYSLPAETKSVLGLVAPTYIEKNKWGVGAVVTYNKFNKIRR